MQELKCPNCGEVFQVDESGYAQILQQVRGKEFDVEVARQAEVLEQQHKKELEAFQANQALILERALAEKQQESDTAIAGKDAQLAQLDKRILELESQLKNSGSERELAVTQAESKKDQERADALAKKDAQLAEQEKRIAELENRLEASGTEKELAVTQAKTAKEQELSRQKEDLLTLQGQLEREKSESQLKEKSLKEQYEAQLKAKDEQIEYYKDFKARQSTKMVGESLEQHCQIQFNQLRMTAFPNAYFEKDNDARTGSKGDFIFREREEGTEFISIMFEMKNEMDETATKHKNEDFLKELDRDRREKKCEYAVLVSLLEIDNEYYNNGIVDVSYKYEKMYVIRPQFFIPIITLLRNAALGSLTYRRQLEAVRHQQLDILQFEENMNTFKEGFARNYRLASDKFKKAVDEIDKTISSLQKMKDYLLSSENNLRLANNKAEELSIKKLTKGAPAVKEMFDNLKNEGAEKGEGTYERDSQD